jgi:oxalate---CoA ligase
VCILRSLVAFAVVNLLHLISLKLRQAGQALYVCVLKHFYERSPYWKDIREANLQGGLEQADIEENDDGDTNNLLSLKFETMDSQHLASLPLLRARITKLLKASPNHIHASQTLLPKIVSNLLIWHEPMVTNSVAGA